MFALQTCGFQVPCWGLFSLVFLNLSRPASLDLHVEVSVFPVVSDVRMWLGSSSYAYVEVGLVSFLEVSFLFFPHIV